MKKKPAKKKVQKKRKPAPRAKSKPAKTEKPIGAVTHFYGGIKVAIAKFKVPVKAGSEVKFKGATTDFAQKIESMQFDHEPVRLAKKGQQVGIKVKKRVREGDLIYKNK